MLSRRRIPVRVFAWLTAGGLINIAVAWVCVAFAIKTGVVITSTGATGTIQPLSEAELRRLPQTDWPLTPNRMAIWVLEGSSPGVRVRNALSVSKDYATTQYQGGHNYGLMRETAAGWPMLSMSGERIAIWEEMISTHGRNNWLLEIAPGRTDPMNPTALPLRPMWPGFALNTLLFAALLWALAIGPRTIRARMRRRKGLCPACGYPTGESDICTECGHAVKCRPLRPPLEPTAQDKAQS